MKQTLKRMRKPNLRPTGFALLLIFLTGCAGLKAFPTSKLVEYDGKKKVCREYRIIDPVNLKFEYVKNIACPSVFGFTSSDIPKVLDWAEDAQTFVKERCN